jgi:hypothetical protein
MTPQTCSERTLRRALAGVVIDEADDIVAQAPCDDLDETEGTPEFTRGRGRRAHGPCGDREDPGRCVFWQRCRERELACRRFYTFARAQSGWRTKPLVPSRALFERVFREADDTPDPTPRVRSQVKAPPDPAPEDMILDGVAMEFRKVPGTVNLLASPDGRILRFNSALARWLPVTPFKMNKRWWVAGRGRDGAYTKIGVHACVARAYLANPSGSRWVRHRDGDVSNNAVANLYWGSARGS